MKKKIKIKYVKFVTPVTRRHVFGKGLIPAVSNCRNEENNKNKNQQK